MRKLNPIRKTKPLLKTSPTRKRVGKPARKFSGRKMR